MKQSAEPGWLQDPRVSEWLSTASDEDALLLRTLSDDDRSTTLRRLSALLALEAGEIGVVDAGDWAGMARSAFHRLRERWKWRRVLGSIAPYATRPSRGSPIPGWRIREAASDPSWREDSKLAMARDLVLLHSDMPNGEIARMLRASFPDAPQQQTAAKLIQRMRHELSLLPEALRSTYGRRLLVDVCALGLLIDNAEGDECPVAAFVVERASGLVFASEVAHRKDAWRAFQRSVESSRIRLGEDRLDVPSTRDTVAAVVLPEPASEYQTHFEASDPRVVYMARGERRFGRGIVSAIGPRIGRIQLKPAYTLLGSGTPSLSKGAFQAPLSLREIDLLLRGEVERWNGPILARVEDSGVLAQDASDGGAMDTTLARIEQDIASVFTAA